MVQYSYVLHRLSNSNNSKGTNSEIISISICTEKLGIKNKNMLLNGPIVDSLIRLA